MNQILKIIQQHNFNISHFNDEELSEFSEYCYDIINQFSPISIQEFLVEFHNIAHDIIQNEIKEEEDEKTNYEEKNNIETIYYNHLSQVEMELLQNLEEVRNMKKELAPTRVKILTQKYQPEQRSTDWFNMRHNMLTASDIAGIIGYCKYSKPKDIILKKCGLTKFKGNKFTFHGQMYEPIATSIYENRFNTTVIEFGLIQHEQIPILGASPDGITTEGIMLEIKCPYTRKLNGNVMDKATLGYYVQMQTQMEVCDLEECHFFECAFDVNGYDDLEDYNNDVFIPENIKYMDIIPRQERPLDYIKLPNDRRSSNGQEKGIFLRFKKNNDKEYSYLYPPFTVTTKEQLDWLDLKQVTNSYSFFELVFWKIKTTSTCIVMRDKKWFDTEVTPKITQFWKEVKLRRKIGCDDLLPKKKSNRVMDLSSFSLSFSKKKNQECMIICSSDEEN